MIHTFPRDPHYILSFENIYEAKYYTQTIMFLLNYGMKLGIGTLHAHRLLAMQSQTKAGFSDPPSISAPCMRRPRVPISAPCMQRPRVPGSTLILIQRFHHSCQPVSTGFRSGFKQIMTLLPSGSDLVLSSFRLHFVTGLRPNCDRDHKRHEPLQNSAEYTRRHIIDQKSG